MTDLPRATREFLADREFPELIALDIDDTLVPYLGQVTERVVEAVTRTQQAGITVALATGRTISTTAPVARAAGIDGWVVCSNGAVLATVEPETIIDTKTFDPAPVVRMLQEHVPDAEFAVEDIHGMFHATRLFHAGALGLSIREVPLEHLLTDPVVRLVVRSESLTEVGFADVVERTGVHTTVYGIGDVAWMDVSRPGVSKASMLDELCLRLDLNPARTLVIGDGPNDVEMLRWASTGIAMGHAPSDVLDAADAVTADEAGVGVAEVLEALLTL